MASWINQYDSTFFITLATLLVGAFGLSVKYCLRSRCENINVCYGLLSVHRNVDLESREEMKQIELGIKDEEEK